MKVITKKDLAIIEALQMRYPDLAGITIGTYEFFPDHGTEVVEVKIPEVECEITVIMRNKKVEKLFFPPFDPTISYKPVAFAVTPRGLRSIPC